MLCWFPLYSKLTQPYIQFSSVRSLSHVWLFAAPWTAACQASLSITNSRSLLELMSIELVMSSNHLILCFPLLLLPSIFPSIRVFSNGSALHIRWPKYWSFSFSCMWLCFMCLLDVKLQGWNGGHQFYPMPMFLACSFSYFTDFLSYEFQTCLSNLLNHMS